MIYLKTAYILELENFKGSESFPISYLGSNVCLNLSTYLRKYKKRNNGFPVPVALSL